MSYCFHFLARGRSNYFSVKHLKLELVNSFYNHNNNNKFILSSFLSMNIFIIKSGKHEKDDWSQLQCDSSKSRIIIINWIPQPKSEPSVTYLWILWYKSPPVNTPVERLYLGTFQDQLKWLNFVWELKNSTG